MRVLWALTVFRPAPQTMKYFEVIAFALLTAGVATGFHDGEHGIGPQEGVQPKWSHAAKSSVPTFVGTGEHRYLWNPDWLVLPKGRQWLGSTHGCIVTDRLDRVFLSAETGHTVLCYQPDGQLEYAFGAGWGGGVHGLSMVVTRRENAPPGKGQLIASGQWPNDDPRWEHHRETLWVVHTGRGEAIETNLRGQTLRTVSWPEASGKYEGKKQYKPTSVALGPKGTIFVADGYGQSWIHRFTYSGKYLDSFGGRGDAPENLNTPHGLWMDWNQSPPTLLVADRENHRLVRYDLEGKFIESTDGSSGILRRPCHVQFQGKLGVVSDLAGRVTLIDDKLLVLAQLGDNPNTKQHAQYHVAPQDWREGAFCAPHCARLDSQGRLYVMDWNVAGRLTRLEPAPVLVSPDSESEDR